MTHNLYNVIPTAQQAADHRLMASKMTGHAPHCDIFEAGGCTCHPQCDGPPTQQPPVTATQRRIDALRAVGSDDPMAAELIESLAAQDICRQAAEQFHRERDEAHTALAALVSDVNEMVARLAASIGAPQC